MIFIFYGLWFLGLVFLGVDLTGRFNTSIHAARALRVLGVVAVTVPAVVPLMAVYGRWWMWSGLTFPVIAHAYTALAVLYLVGLFVGRAALGRLLARCAYVGLLVLAAIPSFILLPIAGPTVGLAGLALARSYRRTQSM